MQGINEIVMKEVTALKGEVDQMKMLSDAARWAVGRLVPTHAGRQLGQHRHSQDGMLRKSFVLLQGSTLRAVPASHGRAEVGSSTVLACWPPSATAWQNLLMAGLPRIATYLVQHK
jgi:hypothetical protein